MDRRKYCEVDQRDYGLVKEKLPPQGYEDYEENLLRV